MTATSSDDAAESYGVKARWGAGVDEGFLAVPNLLLKKQHELGLSPSELVTLLNVLMHWWSAEKLPFPGAAAIAKRTGTTQRTVERNIRSLIGKGYLRRATQDERKSLDPSGIVNVLEGMALEIKGRRGDIPPQVEVQQENPLLL